MANTWYTRLRWLIFVAFISTTFNMSAQQDSIAHRPHRSSIFVELGGNAVEQVHWCSNIHYCHPWSNFSLNYDHIFHIGRKSMATIRVGSSIPFRHELHIIPILINGLFGKRSLKFELGFGGQVIFIHPDYSKLYFGITGIIGMRYVNLPKHIIARIGITPSVGIVGSIWAGSILGFSLGYNF